MKTLYLFYTAFFLALIGCATSQMAYQGEFCSNSSKDKFVYATSYANILHFYQWDGDSLKIIRKLPTIPTRSWNVLI